MSGLTTAEKEAMKTPPDIQEAVEEAVEPLLALLFAVVHGHIGQNGEGQEMIRLSASDFKRIRAAVEGS